MARRGRSTNPTPPQKKLRPDVNSGLSSRKLLGRARTGVRRLVAKGSSPVRHRSAQIGPSLRPKRSRSPLAGRHTPRAAASRSAAVTVAAKAAGSAAVPPAALWLTARRVDRGDGLVRRAIGQGTTSATKQRPTFTAVLWSDPNLSRGTDGLQTRRWRKWIRTLGRARSSASNQVFEITGSSSTSTSVFLRLARRRSLWWVLCAFPASHLAAFTRARTSGSCAGAETDRASRQRPAAQGTPTPHSAGAGTVSDRREHNVRGRRGRQTSSMARLERALRPLAVHRWLRFTISRGNHWTHRRRRHT
jgi:hypothetical protein